MWLLSNKVKVVDSGLLEGFRDCHCHLLPGVDDGVKELHETLKILERWLALGVREVWLTPHIMEDMPNKTQELKERYENLKTVAPKGIALRLAAENMMDKLFSERLDERDLMPLGQDGKYLLVETSYYNPPMDMQRLFERIKESGYIPVLAHPERDQYMEMDDYNRWKQRGVRLQLNVPSLVGAYGPEVQHKAQKLLEKEMYDYCGTDTHSMRFVEYFLDSKISKKTVRKVQQIVAYENL